MIDYDRYTLDNGLTVILHQDQTTPLVFVNMLYKVGSKNEQADKSGLSHLLEHLMFTGTDAVPDFDIPVQRAGGDNNAFTSNDITNYHTSAPAKNLEVLLWLEADRMENLKINQESFEIQQNVVIEEFYETCIDEPYGDSWHHISAQAYHKHPYRWPVIGLTPESVATLTRKDAVKYYHKYYKPSNAILVITGLFDKKTAKKLVQKWFGNLNSSQHQNHRIPHESTRNEERRLIIKNNVNTPALFISYSIPKRVEKNFYFNDILSDILANGRSSRLYRKLVKEKQIFSTIDAYTNGVSDEGLLIIDGKLNTGISIEEAEESVLKELDNLMNKKVQEEELHKVINKSLFSMVVSEYSALNKAMNLAYYEYLGNVNLINQEAEIYKKIGSNQLLKTANETFNPKNRNVIHYLPNYS